MMLAIVIIAVLIMSAAFHEVAHGLSAYWQGDTTAKDAGRLTLNPIKHLDPIGSVVLPLIFLLSKSNFFFAWAKPVPYNPFRLRDAKYGGLKVALAGPASNFLLALVFGFVCRFMPMSLVAKYGLVNAFFSGSGGLIGGDYSQLMALMSGSMSASIFVLSFIICLINLSLMIFNLIPLPPLDGSKVLFPFLPRKLQELYLRLEFSPFGFIIVLGLLYAGLFDIFFSLIPVLFSAITGIR
ncbi:MAG: site-2 protease family protein [Candidatus Falkowbacteria bacterium]